MLIREETEGDFEAIDAAHTAAFSDGRPGSEPAGVGLVRALRDDPGWIGALSLVAEEPAVGLVGHVVCSLGFVGDVPTLGLGPIGVLPDHRGRGVDAALIHAVVDADDGLGYPVIVLLGHVGYYARFGFVPSCSLGTARPDQAWGDAFQALPLSAWSPSIKGEFRYAAPSTICQRMDSSQLAAPHDQDRPGICAFSARCFRTRSRSRILGRAGG